MQILESEYIVMILYYLVGHYLECKPIIILTFCYWSILNVKLYLFTFWHIFSNLHVKLTVWLLHPPPAATNKSLFEFYTILWVKMHSQTFWPQSYN